MANTIALRRPHGSAASASAVERATASGPRLSERADPGRAPRAVLVRRAHRGHLERLVPLLDAFRVSHGHASDVAGVRDFLRSELGRPDAVLFAAFDPEVAWRDRRRGAHASPIGIASARRSTSILSLRPVWEIGAVYVVPERRFRGIGGQLVLAVITTTRAAGAGALTLRVGRDNLPGHLLCQARGIGLARGFAHYELPLAPPPVSARAARAMRAAPAP